MKVDFHFELSFDLESKEEYVDWLNRVLAMEGAKGGELNYIFCNDEHLLQINKQYLEHDTYTDIITFDYTDNGLVGGDIFISKERVEENAQIFKVTFKEELKRVMVHGLLHLLGYKDKSENDAVLMRQKENEAIKLFHVER